MYLPDRLPLPWRALRALERARLAWPLGPAATLPGPAPDAAGTVTVAAIGDVFLARRPPVPGAGLGDLAARLRAADVATCNLEAPLGEGTGSGPLGGTIRGAPGTAEELRECGVTVANVAGNHALDGGQAGFGQTLQQLADAGVSACGVAGADGLPHLLEREAGGLRLGFLGCCDDHAPMPRAPGAPMPALALPASLPDAVAAAARRVDALVVHLHWGYEFRLHPLRRHRDLARTLVDRGARLVLCHHAHVPMGVERRGAGLIAYGLGNAAFPLTAYLREGHPWTDRSVLLETQLSRGGVEGARLVPFALDDGGTPCMTGGQHARRLLTALAIASARLDDEAFLAASERAQLAFEAATLVGALAHARARGRATLEARLATLQLPRQQALVDWIARQPQGSSLGAALSALAAAAHAGTDVLRAYEVNAGALATGLRQLVAGFRWRDALASRLP